MPLTSMTHRRAQATPGSGKKEAERSKNMFTLGLLSWMYHRPTEGTIRFLERTVPPQAGDRRGQHRRVPGRLQLRRDDRGLRGLLRDQARADGAGPLPQHLRQPGARPRAGRRRPALGPAACSSARTRSRRRRTSCTSCPSTRPSACGPSRPRTRSPASARRSAPSFGGALGVTTTSGPGRLAEVRGDRAGGDDRAAADRRRRAARRARRPGCRPRPSSRTCCRRCSAATARRRCR